jgi:succinate-semialdehyde dehydrogenase/glutarate-semialdehyde dehydrogenase
MKRRRDLVGEYAVVDPSTGETIKRYPTFGDAQLEAAVERAHAAHAGWSLGTTVRERAALIRRVGELHEERRQRLGEIVCREMGKPIEQAAAEVAFSAAVYAYYAENATALLADEPLDLPDGDGSAFIRRSSLGVVLGIMPWNYPFSQVARFAGPSLMVGNTVLLKHAPQCPESAEAIERIFQDAGVPVDAYINIYASNEQTATVIADPRVQGVSLTGSGRAGAAVAELAGRHLKKVVLELGGSDPFLVLGTDDLDAVVAAAVAARLPNGGQACNAAKRFIVIDELYDPFLEKLTAALSAVEPGDPRAPGTVLGPLSSTAASERLEDQVRRAIEAGATLVTGGGRDGNFFQPTVLTGITHENPAYTEELFGPVAAVYKVSSEEEAITLANDTPYGLGSYLFTDDQEQALRVADRLEAGMVFVNTIQGGGPELPFGGVKASGFGRELGRLGADEFVNKKLIRVGGRRP